MKSIFDNTVRQELSTRINSLSPQHTAQWGRMNVYQMVKHCTLCEDMFLGKLKIKRVFIGRLIGPMVLRKILKDDKPFGKNSPTSPVLKTFGDTGDMEQQKREWLNRVGSYTGFNDPNFVHPFFGPMSKEQVGVFAYKHADHHLRQFGV